MGLTVRMREGTGDARVRVPDRREPHQCDVPYIVFGAPHLDEADIAEVVESLRSGWIGTGPKVRRFEDALRDYLGVESIVAVNSCTAALHLAMVASGVGQGDEVITTPMTFCATANAILHTGAVPVFADVGAETMNIDPLAVAAAITPRTKAILPVHFAGRPCDMATISKTAALNGLLVIEDAAHCIEGSWAGRKIGAISPLTCFSFYVTKSLVTAEGGAVATNDAALAAKIKTYALHGMSADAWHRFSDRGYKHYDVVFPGFKYNMTDIQASLGLHQVAMLDDRLVRRAAIWSRYDEAFRDLDITLPSQCPSTDVHARHLYTILVERERCGVSRDELLRALHDRGIGTGVHYRALHLHPYYRERFGYREGMFPNAERIGDSTLSLPLSAKLTDEEVTRVIDGVRDVLDR